MSLVQFAEAQLGFLTFALGVTLTAWGMQLAASRERSRRRGGHRFAPMVVGLATYLGLNLGFLVMPGSGLVAIIGGLLGGLAVHQRFAASFAQTSD